MTPSLLDRWTRGWRGPVLAALVALASVLPGVLRLPVTDRSEARLAEASAQMLEDHDFAAAAVDEDLRDRSPLAVHWLQAAAAAATSDPEARQIWAFRIPTAIGAMVAAAACAWGGAALFGPSAGFLAGVMLSASLLLGVAGVIDAPGALLCAGVTLAVSALARLRLAHDGAFAAGKRTRLLFWLGLSLATASGGLVGPVAVGLTAAALWLAERRAAWLKDLGWGWGLVLLAALVGPTLVAGAVDGGQPAPVGWLFAGSGERTPGLQLLMAPLLLWPFALLLPAWLMIEFARGQSPEPANSQPTGAGCPPSTAPATRVGPTRAASRTRPQPQPRSLSHAARRSASQSAAAVRPTATGPTRPPEAVDRDRPSQNSSRVRRPAAKAPS